MRDKKQYTDKHWLNACTCLFFCPYKSVSNKSVVKCKHDCNKTLDIHKFSLKQNLTNVTGSICFQTMLQHTTIQKKLSVLGIRSSSWLNYLCAFSPFGGHMANKRRNIQSVIKTEHKVWYKWFSLSNPLTLIRIEEQL